MKIFAILVLILLSAFNKTDKIQSIPVSNFNVNKYLGLWYEIARTDNRFEKGCTNVTANYSLRQDGGLNVVNKCLIKDKEKMATGKAYFKSENNIASLKVTFFWPFYGNYNVVYLDNDYRYAIVDGGSKEYVWILSRTKTIDGIMLNTLLEKIKQNGFNADALIYTKHHD
jgi:apolipoprotein D and lipocalin family protein